MRGDELKVKEDDIWYSEDLIKYIIKKTGLNREIILKVLRAEHQYYLNKIIEG